MSAFANPALVLGALGAAAGGWIALSLAMERHWQNQHGRGTAPTARQRRRLQGSGAAGLLVSCLVCLFVWGAAQGWVAWAGVLTAMALAAAWILSYAPRRAGVLARVFALFGACFIAGGAALYNI